MKKIIQFTLILLLFSCQKDQYQSPAIHPLNPKQNNEITIDQAQEWLNAQPDTNLLKKYPVRWSDAKNIPTKNGNRIAIALPGQPTYQNLKQGYRQLSIQRNPQTNQIEANFLEIIPEAIYFQNKGKVEPKDFTGRIFEYDLSYHLIRGKLYAQGKPVGEARAASPAERTNFNANSDQHGILGSFEQHTPSSAKGKLAMARVTESCTWYQSSYIDAEGIININAERICTFSISDNGWDDMGYLDSGIGTGPAHGGGGGGSGSTNSTPAPPPPSELPMENQSSVDPKKMMDCFSNISDPNAAYQIKVFVLEPLPGTSFNIGPNAFGHVALQLTKAGANQVITQTIGFYPSGTGLDKLSSPSRIIDNGGLEYTMSATYWTNAGDFQKVIDYVSSPPKNYHYTDFNCTAFVYGAGRAGNVPIPDPTTQIGLAGAGGAGYAMTPQGMASALSQQKASNPSADVSKASGRATASKGECNSK